MTGSPPATRGPNVLEPRRQHRPAVARTNGAPGHRLLFDLDPSLGAGLDERLCAGVASRLVVPTEAVAQGDRIDFPAARDAVAVMVVAGALALRSQVPGGRNLEILPPGSFCRPGEDNPASFVQSWIVALTESRIAIIDRPTYARLSRFPAITEEIISRLSQQGRAAHAQKAVDSQMGLERRVLLSLWHLAERCGRTRYDGIEVPIPLTHELFAEYLGAARPSVTTTLQRLVNAGLITRTANRGWLLRRDSLDRLLAE